MNRSIKRFSLVFVLLLNVALLSEAQNRSKTHDVYEALTGVDIKVDGKMSDWDGVFDAVVGTNGKPFIDLPAGDGGKKAFQEHGGGKWNGKDDHRTGIMMVWNPDAFYVGLLVTDDKHDDPPNGWNGDTLQFALETSGKRKAGLPMILYNMGLAKGKMVINNEKAGKNGLGDKDVMIVRDEAAKKTYYEVKLAAEEILKKGKFQKGMEFGVGICVNDGDPPGEKGQKGWSGWYCHSIVHGKNSEKTGLLRLTDKTLSVNANGKLTTNWSRIRTH
ncbi:MAG: hypothetical protein QGI86_12390 [Candidatus Poribacteria bacterium]|jgi:hypothetical protein|nr:hypothetical protein [Candidatus Poribacteria bacterium]MDP6751720.1 hypothetical protein [Candidatus Poribacteria bacterium]MDP6997356.1 hypothetical protein [Candidatus Poribacteria bacterium]